MLQSELGREGPSVSLRAGVTGWLSLAAEGHVESRIYFLFVYLFLSSNGSPMS